MLLNFISTKHFFLAVLYESKMNVTSFYLPTMYLPNETLEAFNWTTLKPNGNAKIEIVLYGIILFLAVVGNTLVILTLVSKILYYY